MSGSADKTRQSKPGLDPAREVAFDLLWAVEDGDAYANLLLPQLLRERGLTGRDAAFATELAFSTLRLQGRYDTIIAEAADRDPDRIDIPVLCLLRLGAHQLLGMNVPDYAAVSAMVELTRRRIGGYPAKFVNAVLCKISSRNLDDWARTAFPSSVGDETAYLAVAQSHPEWIIRAFSAALKAAERPPEELVDLLRVNNTAPSVSLVARPGRIDAKELASLTGGSAGRWSPWAVDSSGDPGDVPEVRSGAVAVQDEGSQLMALALSRVPLSIPEASWLDMCAGPGGKAADLAGIAHERGARLTAIEQHPHRAELVRNALRWQGEPMGEVIVADATTDGWAPGMASRVLLDAPCTGLGAVRRRPELRWRRLASDVPGLVAIQRKLLLASLDAVAPGGVVAYVTCSPHIAETDRIVNHALSKRPEVSELDARELQPEVPDTGEGLRVRLWPHLHNTDGMFLSILQRAAA